jgi:tyrosine-protein kinase Etk/Wzc
MTIESKNESGAVGFDTHFLNALKKFLHILWDSRKLIVKVTGIVTILAIVISLILPKSYKSTSVLIPDTDESKMMGLAGLSNLASMVGLNIGNSDPEKLYPAVIQSEAVLREVIYAKYKTEKFDSTVNLIEYWKIDEDSPVRDFEVALKKLQDNLDIDYDRATSIVTISDWMREPQLAADVLSNTVAELDKFFRTKRITSATEQRKWIEVRLGQVKDDLAKSEDKLEEFRKVNRATMNSPELQMAEARLIREVDINSAEYVELKRQYEIIKIQEIKNTPVINVMDAARPAGKKDKPKRLFIVLACFVLSFGGVVTYVYVKHELENDIRDLVKEFFPNGIVLWPRRGRKDTSGEEQG